MNKNAYEPVQHRQQSSRNCASLSNWPNQREADEFALFHPERVFVGDNFLRAHQFAGAVKWRLRPICRFELVSLIPSLRPVCDT